MTYKNDKYPTIDKVALAPEPIIKETLCKMCKLIKLRIHCGKHNDTNKTDRWIGEDNKFWNGRICGTCHLKEASISKRKVKAENRIKDYEKKIQEQINKLVKLNVEERE